MAKENVQLLKNVKPQEVNLLVQTTRSNDPVSGNVDCENVFKTSKHWRKNSNLQKCAKMCYSGKESLLECAARPLPT